MHLFEERDCLELDQHQTPNHEVRSAAAKMLAHVPLKDALLDLPDVSQTGLVQLARQCPLVDHFLIAIAQ